jgi:hypothetical protein
MNRVEIFKETLFVQYLHTNAAKVRNAGYHGVELDNAQFLKASIFTGLFAGFIGAGSAKLFMVLCTLYTNYYGTPILCNAE